MIRKSSRKVAGRPVMGRANASTKREREAIAFVKERYMAMVALDFREKDKREYDLEEDLWVACIYSSDIVRGR